MPAFGGAANLLVRGVAGDQHRRHIATALAADRLDAGDAVGPVAQVQVGQDHVGRAVEKCHRPLGLRDRAGGDGVVAPLLQQPAQAFADLLLVVEHEHGARLQQRHRQGVGAGGDVLKVGQPAERDAHAEHRSAARLRGDDQLVPEQAHQTLDDRQPHAQPLRAHALAAADLKELVENLAQVGGADADAGVPDLHVDVRFGRARDHDDAAALGVFDRVLHQVAEDAFEQLRVRADRLAARREAQPQALLLGLPSEVHVQAPEQVTQRKLLHARLDRAGIQPRDVEHHVERAVEPVDRATQVAHQRLLGGTLQALLERCREQAYGVHRLAQVVARDREEATLLLIGLDRNIARRFEPADAVGLVDCGAGRSGPAAVQPQRQQSSQCTGETARERERRVRGIGIDQVGQRG